MSNPLAVSPKVLMLPDDVDVNDIPRRPYEFNKGDRRFTDPTEAIDWSVEKAIETGRRRFVRKDSSPDFQPLWISQEVGS